MKTSDYIKHRRQELGMTMKELAQKVGVSEGTVSRWESGNISNMRRDKIKLLADALDTLPSEIMGWNEPYVIPVKAMPGYAETMERINIDLDYVLGKRKDSIESRVADAYSKADERIKKAVRDLLEIDE